MARIINPTNGVVVSPLFIEERHLFALDKVFDDFIEERKSEEGDAEAKNLKSSDRHND